LQPITTRRARTRSRTCIGVTWTERSAARWRALSKIDTSSAAGELIFHVFGAIAHFERRLIGERTKQVCTSSHVRSGSRWKCGSPKIESVALI